MKNLAKHIPNTITLLNLFSGCVAIVLIASNPTKFSHLTAYCIFLSAVFDLLDGMIARALKVSSSIGKDLDSLSDVISFGVVPSLLAWHILYLSLRVPFSEASFVVQILYLSPFLMAVFSALRLAKFNNDETQTTSFKGLPTPANALVWACLYLSMQYAYDTTQLQGNIATFLLEIPLAVPFFSIVSAFLLIAPIRLMSAKVSAFSLQKYPYHIIFIACAFALIFIFHFASAPFILFLYFIFSYLHYRRA